MSFRIELLDKHDRDAFSCGVPALDRYFQNQASQDMRRRAAICYVAVANDTDQIGGFYTLAAAEVPLTDLPEAMVKRLPRYPSVPVARLGRLAVDHSYQNQKLGAALLWDAVRRAARAEIAVYALIVDAKDERAGSFYHYHGFQPFGHSPRQFMLPLASIRQETAKAPAS